MPIDYEIRNLLRELFGPCPRCRYPRISVSGLLRADGSTEKVQAFCPLCGFEGPVGRTKEEAADRWRRVIDVTLNGQIVMRAPEKEGGS